MSKPLVNRVANSSIVTINLEGFFPNEELVEMDLTHFLFKGLIIREKDFRQSLDDWEWASLQGKNLCVYCSTDAIIPMWAYQLVAIKANPHAHNIFQGTSKEYIAYHYIKELNALDLSQYQDKRIVIKGCSDKPVPAVAYAEIAKLLQPVAKKLMYGEPCSMVPLYNKK